MDKEKQKQEPLKSQIHDAAADLLAEGKKFAHVVCEDSLNSMNQAEEQLKKHSDELLKKVQEHPLASLLIAGGIGFLLSKLLKK